MNNLVPVLACEDDTDPYAYAFARAYGHAYGHARTNTTPRINKSGIFGPLPTRTPRPFIATDPVVVQPPSTGDAGLR